jgi:hypothetical protein
MGVICLYLGRKTGQGEGSRNEILCHVHTKDRSSFLDFLKAFFGVFSVHTYQLLVTVC